MSTGLNINPTKIAVRVSLSYDVIFQLLQSNTVSPLLLGMCKKNTGAEVRLAFLWDHVPCCRSLSLLILTLKGVMNLELYNHTEALTSEMVTYLFRSG